MGLRSAMVITILESILLVKSPIEEPRIPGCGEPADAAMLTPAMSSNAHSLPGIPAGSPPKRRRTVFTSTVVLGRVAGVEIGLNWTWIIVFGLIVWSFSAV